LNPNSVAHVQLGYWPFDDTNTWVGEQGQLPLLATNIVGIPSWFTNAVLIDSTNTAILRYRDVEPTNYAPANINCRNGTMRFWFAPDWSSGAGPGSAGRLIEMGTQTTSNGWWALYFNTNGTQLIFGTQTNGLAMTNLTTSINWVSNYWHQIVLTYSPSNSSLYLDGQPVVTNGLGTTYYPNRSERANGFGIGSDANGSNQARGAFDELETFNYPLAASDIATNFLTNADTIDSTGSGIPDWWWLKYFGQTTNVDPYGDPAGDGWNNLQKFQNGMNPNVFYTPPTPQGVTVTYNPTTGTATVSWLPSPGPVTGYTVNMNGTDYNVSSKTLSFENSVSGDNLFYDPADEGPTIFANFQVQADYAGGDSAWSDQVPLESHTPFYDGAFSASLIPGPGGSAWVAMPTIPPGTVTLRITRIDEYAEENYGNSSFDTNFDIPAVVSTNGLYVLPTSWSATAAVDSYGYSYYDWWVQAVDADGNPSGAALLTAGGYYDDNSLFYNDYYMQTGAWPVTPYFDGREQLKQNLIFLLRAGLDGAPLQFTELDSYNNYVTFSHPTNYAFASFYGFGNLSGYHPAASVSVFLPFGENYLYRNFVFSLTDVENTGGLLTSFTNNFVYWGNGLGLNEPPTYQFQPPTTSGTVIAPVLATNQMRWLFSYLPPPYDYTFSPIGIIQSGATNQMLSNVRNAFGLQFLSTEIAYETGTSVGTCLLYPEDSTTQDGYFYSETAQPQLQTVEYDFWNPPYWPYYDTNIMSTLPGMPGFSPTNKSQLLIANVGEINFRVASYAKMTIQNGYSGVYGYLGQYFTNAYEINTNDVVTTNSAGVLSPYGDFFPTVPGPAALVTMPDPDTGARGTCTVYCISLALDKNHDGNMDLSFGGTDSTSGDQPYIFWANNNYDRLTPDEDDNTNYEDDVQIANNPGTSVPEPDCNYSSVLANGYSYRAIPTKRDLEDFTRLWVCGVTSNLLAALPAGSMITLSWADIWDGAEYTQSGNPTIDLFAAADADGGMDYLTNETIAAQQTNAIQCPYIGRLSPGQSIQLNASRFNGWAGNHFIWCGVSNGTGGLTLTIADANSNVLAQASQWIQIKDIKDMYERWTVGDNPNKAPTNTAQIAATDLPDPTQPLFQYAPPQDTNTPYILFVHGWNMEAWEKDRFAETAFKRLYWQGYQGRFGVFRWPTENGFKGISSLATDPSEKDNFDRSEYTAWQSSVGLLNKLKDLNAEYPGHVYMLAHSMGNIVAGEALRLATQQGLGHLVNTYVASQAAVSAHTYDTNIANYSFNYFPWRSQAVTPNIYGNWFLGNNGGGAGQVVNFYNTNDYALQRSVWQLNQLLKPDQFVLLGGTHWDYSYVGVTNDPPPWNHFQKDASLQIWNEVNFDIVNVLTNRYEVMGLAAESYTTALGATPGVHNVADSIYLGRSTSRIWPVDTTGNNYAAHFWHSAEFRGDYWQQQGYWSELLGSDAFNLK
jgi:hypothetical protein